MDFVVDSNILISALIKPEGKIRGLLFSDILVLYAPEFVFMEINKHRNLILDKSGFTVEEFELIKTIIMSRIKIVPDLDFISFSETAKDCCPDPDDWLFFALALKLNAPLWSDDKLLKNQTKIVVLNTSEIVGLLSK